MFYMLRKLPGPVPVFGVLLLVLCPSLVADDIRFQRDADILFVNASDVAVRLEMKLDVVRPGTLLTFCTTGDGAVCIPIRLNEDNHRGDGDELLLTADAVESSLSVSVKLKDNTVSLKKKLSDGYSSETPAYNAEWGAGRGFGRGQTVPDIPFVDLNGNEVRLSQFLGKRYILYCWASW